MLSVVIPCYNEEKNIPFLVKRFVAVLEKKPDSEIIFVNNGSTDASGKVFEEILSGYPLYNMSVFHVPKNQGYGYGILQGLYQAKGEVLSWTHADMQTDPLDILDGLALFEKAGPSQVLVKGKRKNRQFLDEFFTWGMEVIASAVLRKRLHDINAQPKIFSRSFFNQVAANAPYDFSLDLYFLYMAATIGAIVDFPVFFADRLHGEAKGGGTLKGKYKLTRRTLAYIFELGKQLKKQRPADAQ